MIRCASHPIAINGSSLDEVARALAPLARAVGEMIGVDLKTALLRNANRLDYGVDDSPEARSYEAPEHHRLTSIGRTSTGAM
jgi:hypothetical protein